MHTLNHMPPTTNRRHTERRATPLDRSAQINRTISHAVNVLMADQQMSRPELAEALGYTAVSTISRSLGGLRQWSILDLVQMAELFGVTVEQLLGGSLVVRNRCFRQGVFELAAA